MAAIDEAGPAGNTASTPDAEAFRRTGLTPAEARRREQVERWRAETQSPWEAPPAGLAVWLVWRTFMKGLQPVWLIVSLGIAAWFGLQWLGAAGGVAAVTDPLPGDEARLVQAIRQAVPEGADARLIWNRQLASALDGDRRRRPDIDRFRAWAALGPDLIGREPLALDVLAGPAGPVALDARLRAGAPWQRTRLLEAGYAEALGEGTAQGLDPRELVFADPGLVRRYARSQFEWSVAASSADAFFRGSRQGELELRSLPGLVADRRASGAMDGATRLFGGVRHLVIQACAHGAARLTGCDAAIIPAERPDPVRYALAALESGLVSLPLAGTPVSGSDVRNGARILQAARQAGRLSPALEAELGGLLAEVAPSAVMTDTLAIDDVRLDLAFAAPERAGQNLAGRVSLPSSPSALALVALLRDVAHVRADTSPVIAIRLMEGLATPDAVRRLRDVAGILGPRTLAARDWLGDGLLDILDRPAGDIAVDRPQLKMTTLLALISAALVFALTLIRLATPSGIRRASRISWLDAAISHSLLGRKT